MTNDTYYEGHFLTFEDIIEVSGIEPYQLNAELQRGDLLPEGQGSERRFNHANVVYWIEKNFPWQQHRAMLEALDERVAAATSAQEAAQ